MTTLPPLAKRSRLSPTLKEELERHQINLEKSIVQCRMVLSNYLSTIEASIDETSIVETRRLSKEGIQQWEYLLKEFDRMKGICLFNHTRAVRNDARVCHRCCCDEYGGGMEDTTTTTTTTTATAKLLQCGCFQEGCQTPLLHEKGVSAHLRRGLRLCRSCTDILLQEKPGSTSSTQSSSTMIICAVCQALDCRIDAMSGRRHGYGVLCDSEMVDVKNVLQCSAPQNNNSTTATDEPPNFVAPQYVCRKCTQMYMVTELVPFITTVQNKKQIHDNDDDDNNSSNHDSSEDDDDGDDGNSDQQSATMFVPSWIIPKLQDRHLSKHQRGLSFTEESGIMGNIDESVLYCILKYLHAKELQRFGLTNYSNYRIADAYAEQIYNKKKDLFLNHVDDTKLASSKPVNFYHRLYLLEERVYVNYGFKFLKDPIGARRYLHRSNPLLFTSVKEPSERRRLVRGCQVTRGVTGMGFELGAICDNIIFQRSSSVNDNNSFCIVGCFRQASHRPVSIHIGLVASDCNISELMTWPRKWVGMHKLPLSQRQRLLWTSRDIDHSDLYTYFCMRYEESSKSLSMSIRIPDFRGGFRIIEESQTVKNINWNSQMEEELPDGLKWAIMMDSNDTFRAFPVVFTLRDCTTFEWQCFHEKMVLASGNPTSPA